ncbi:MAG: exosortase family protein XrtF [Flavobacteriaceae bacterium]|nr:exosortase family protein XrtF [Flavobacteriaceae bacterium]
MWKEFKPILYFIGRFFVVYIVLTALYSWYLQPYLYEYKIADPVTTWMTDVSVGLMNLVGFDAQHVQLEGEAYRRFILDGEFASRVNEGCNAISVMIIFVSFILAFAAGFKKTLLFLLGGLLIMLISNIIRIAMLTWIYRYWSEYSKVAHDILFPGIIYGTVIILWLVWVKYFAFKK